MHRHNELVVSHLCHDAIVALPEQVVGIESLKGPFEAVLRVALS